MISKAMPDFSGKLENHVKHKSNILYSSDVL